MVKGLQGRAYHGGAKSWRRSLSEAGGRVLLHAMTSKVRLPSYVSLLHFYPNIEFPSLNVLDDTADGTQLHDLEVNE